MMRIHRSTELEGTTAALVFRVLFALGLGACQNGGQPPHDAGTDALEVDAVTPNDAAADVPFTDGGVAPADIFELDARSPDALPRPPGSANQWNLEALSVDLPEALDGSFSRRYWGTLTYDDAEQRILFLEGYSGTDHASSIYSNAVYEWRIEESRVRLLGLVGWSNPGDDRFEPIASQPPGPHPRHPYGAFVYHPSERAVYMSFGACTGAHESCDTRLMWRFDTDTSTWTEASSDVVGGQFGGFDTCFEAAGNKVWAFSPSTSGSGWLSVASFDVDSRSWSEARAHTDSDGRALSGLVDTARTPDEEILVWTRHADEAQLVRLQDGEVVGEIVPPVGVAFTRGAVAFGAGLYLFYLSEAQETWAYNLAEATWTLVDDTGPSERIDRYLTYDPVNAVFAIFTIEGTFHTLRFDPSML